MHILPLPKALLIDLDDTLIDLSTGSLFCWDTLAERFAPQAKVDAATLKAAIHHARNWFWADPERHRTWRIQMERAREEIVKIALRELGIHAPQVPRLFSRDYDAMLFERLTLFPRAIDTLQHWRKGGLRMALVTNGSGIAQRRKISAFQLEQYFDCILIEGEFGVGKPDEKVYLHALERLGAAPAESWMIGDRLDWEVAIPQKLGLRGIWVDIHGKGLPHNSPITPDYIVGNIGEVADLMQLKTA